METIRTVLGPIEPENLGFTSMHEHILLDLQVWYEKFGHLIPEEVLEYSDSEVAIENIGLLKRINILIRDNLILDDEGIMILKVNDYKAVGGSAMVEANRKYGGYPLDLPEVRSG